jgi:predicted dehydrogenase
MESDRSVRVGWVGCGGFSYRVLFDCLKKTPIDVVAAADPDASRFTALARRYHVGRHYDDWRDMLRAEALDAVICVANPQVHFEVARAGLLAGLPVFVEKSPCATIRQAEELTALQRSSGKTVMVGFNRRHTPAYARARRIVGDPDFGRTTMYLAKYNAGPYSSESAFLNNHLIHHLDLARYFLGEIDRLHTDRIALDDTRVGFHISLTAASGAIGVLQSASLQSLDYPVERVEITGEGTCVIVDNVRTLTYHRPFPLSPERTDTTRPEEGTTSAWIPNLGSVSGDREYGFEEELVHFATCILAGTVPAPDIEDALKSMRLLEQVKKSAS